MAHSTTSQTIHEVPARQRLLWGWVMLAPIVTWFLHLNLMYFLVQPVCRLGGNWTFHVTTLVLLGVTAFTGLLAWRLRTGVQPDGRDITSQRFAGTFGAIAASMAALAIAAQWVPVLVIGPCQ